MWGNASGTWRDIANDRTLVEEFCRMEIQLNVNFTYPRSSYQLLYKRQDNWVLGLFLSLCIPENRKHDVSDFSQTNHGLHPYKIIGIRKISATTSVAILD
jgi:hypothetical protein